MQKVTLLDELPVDLNRGVGRIVSAHALIEHHLAACVAILSGLGHKERRIVLGSERSESRLQTIKLLMQVHGLKVSVPAQLTAKRLRDVREMRNLMAHGTWARTTQGYSVIQTAGSWPDETGLGSRKIKPAGVVTDANALAAVLAEITVLRKALETLRERIGAALEAAPRTSQ